MSYNAVSIRYEKIWDDYLSELTTMPNLRLCSYLRARGVSVHGYENWMSRHGHSARLARQHALNLQPEPLKKESCTVTESSFVPVVLHEDSHSESNSCDILTGISLTLPDGTVISIRRGSAEAVVSFLKLYSGEGSPCSD